MHFKNSVLFAIAIVFLGFSCTSKENDFGSGEDWSEYLGGKDRNHFSKLSQLNLQNVHQLKVAWEYSLKDSGQMQTNPLVVNQILYGMSPTSQAFAVDAVTGQEIWKFGDPVSDGASAPRGLSYWKEGEDERILFTSGSNLWALDAKTGKPIEDFGENGKVDLHVGLPEIAQKKFIISNTPGTIFENLIILPVRVSEDADAAPGDIRAFDVRSGKLVWTFHTIPYPGEEGYATNPPDAYKNFNVGAANNWAGMSVDVNRGTLFVGTGSMAYDFYGAQRAGDNLFANCLLALDARTGKRKWHFQFVKHDLWDRDLPAPPNLVTLTLNGQKRDVVVQITKNGYIYMFDRDTGEPIHEMKKIKVPASEIPGEVVAEFQYLPTWPLPFSRQSEDLTVHDLSPYAENKKELLTNFNSYKRGLFDPPSFQGTLLLPGFDGGGEWGGAAVDHKGVLYVNASEMAWVIKMKKQEAPTGLAPGKFTYNAYCQSCHQADRTGNVASGYPSLVAIHKKYEDKDLISIINAGRGMMPGFSFIPKEDKDALLQFLKGQEKMEVQTQLGPDRQFVPYKMEGYRKFLDQAGLPAIAPPWGTLNAIDLNTGKHLWKIPLGYEPALESKGIKNTGSETYGGPIVTHSGIVFIAATKDAHLRAFEAATGKLLWEHKLPAAAFANPTTYMANGKQYIVVACGGSKLGTPKGNKYVAFALP